jgi:hypothetical protein
MYASDLEIICSLNPTCYKVGSPNFCAETVSNEKNSIAREESVKKARYAKEGPSKDGT